MLRGEICVLFTLITLTQCAPADFRPPPPAPAAPAGRVDVTPGEVVPPVKEEATALKEKSWNEYKTKFGKKYDNKTRETFRQQIWVKNWQNIIEHNKRAERKEETYTMAINEYTDWTQEEMQKFLTLRVPSQPFNSTVKPPAGRQRRQAPSSIDWRTYSYVTPVQAQGACGSCYAFSALGAIEGQIAKKYRNYVTLSAQNIVDCSGAYGNRGCAGGWMTYAYNYAAVVGVDTQSSYPYTTTAGSCRFNAYTVGARITGYRSVSPDEYSLRSAVGTVGPISVAIDASRSGFSSYSSGVYNDVSCSKTVNHAVLIVGYGTDSTSGLDYWLVKNSYGTSWGQGGYIKMARNKGNMCGIASYATYPLV